MHMYLLATLQHSIAGDKATDGLLELKFVADRSGPSLVYIKALAWYEGGSNTE